MAAAEAGPGTTRHGDVLLTHPQSVDEVFMLLGGPECQPFSRAGHRHGLKDRRARTLWWVLWCLAERQFPSALVENVESLLYMKKGEEWALVQAIAEGIGYKVQAVVDDPLLLGIPHQRKRVFIFFLRDDLAAKWGMPAVFPTPEPLPMLPLEDFLLPAESAEAQAEFADFALLLLEAGLDSEFSEVIWCKDGRRTPHCAWKCGAGGLGQRAFTRSVPAIKVYGGGPEQL
jgi:site-specific DNA-cytosine methylase